MDSAFLSKSMSNMISNEIFRDCNMACFKEESIETDKFCVKNCSSKSVQLLKAFERVTNAELTKIQEASL